MTIVSLQNVPFLSTPDSHSHSSNSHSVILLWQIRSLLDWKSSSASQLSVKAKVFLIATCFCTMAPSEHLDLILTLLQRNYLLYCFEAHQIPSCLRAFACAIALFPKSLWAHCHVSFRSLFRHQLSMGPSLTTRFKPATRLHLSREQHSPLTSLSSTYHLPTCFYHDILISYLVCLYPIGCQLDKDRALDCFCSLLYIQLL